MAVTPATFRADHPEFNDTVSYPDSAINYWLAFGGKFLNADVWGPSATAVQAAGAIAFTAQPSAAQSVTLNGTAVVFGTNVAIGATLGVTLANLLTYLQASSDPQLVLFKYALSGNTLALTAATAGAAGNALTLATTVSGASVSGSTLTGGADAATSPPTTEYDFGLELLTAHFLVLNKRNLDAAKKGALPGVGGGVVASKAVGPASESFDTGLAGEPDAGHWNLTTYGTQYWRLVQMFGAGPLTSHGRPSPYPVSAWGGPGAWPGWFLW